LKTPRKIREAWLKVTSSRKLTRSNPQHLPHHRHKNKAGPGPSLRNCRGSRTLTNDPADPEIIATRTTRAKSKRIDVAKSKDKHDVDTVVYSKSKRIATTGIILRAKTEMFGADTHHPPEHPDYQVTSNNNIRCTVKKPQSTL
jgi:hypothetical protein